MAITWGGYKFKGPWTIESFCPPDLAGVYAVTFKRDPVNHPKRHKIVYFGQSENFAAECFPWHEANGAGWVEQLGGKADIFVFVYPMPHSVHSQRHKVEQDLIDWYDPDCNRM